jgi:hypothetical protein
LVAGLGHLAVGTVDLSLLASLLIGSLPGIALGSVIASRAPECALRLARCGTYACRHSFGRTLNRQVPASNAVRSGVGQYAGLSPD